MAVANWPYDVPFLCSLRALSSGGARGHVTGFQPDAGPQKLRRITTAGYKPLMGQTPILTPSQYQMFVDFWVYTIADGTLSFSAVHPMTGEITVFQSDGSPYEEMMPAPGLYKIGLSLVVLP